MNLLKQSCISRLLVSETLQVESFFNQHTIELSPSDHSPPVTVSLLKKSIKSNMYFLVAILKFPLPGFKVPNPLCYKLVKCKLVIIILEGIFKET